MRPLPDSTVGCRLASGKSLVKLRWTFSSFYCYDQRILYKIELMNI